MTRNEGIVILVSNTLRNAPAVHVEHNDHAFELNCIINDVFIKI